MHANSGLLGYLACKKSTFHNVGGIYFCIFQIVNTYCIYLACLFYSQNRFRVTIICVFKTMEKLFWMFKMFAVFVTALDLVYTPYIFFSLIQFKLRSWSCLYSETSSKIHMKWCFLFLFYISILFETEKSRLVYVKEAQHTMAKRVFL